ncbi:hypothetical protein GQX73_g3598 [Xylaria multiplex]|uniref:Rhodopsin domain-containing protein n=1 Tax=Xylaria multiplex TaxID=323545 RepID=A0A7C8MUP2_9PEZI|nr:hypothetical protein GQX73_g3598 [Xylaria multiplex]
MATNLTTAEMNENMQPNLIAMCIAILFFSTLALSLRFWSNYVTPSYRWWWDDFFAAITLPFSISASAFLLWFIYLGFGKHAATVPPADLEKCRLFSVLFFYARIFQRTSKCFTFALWTVGILNTIWLLTGWALTIFQCRPINAAWETVPGSTCIKQWGLCIAVTVPNLLIDLLLLILPLPMLWGLQATAFRRIIVVIIFVFGYAIIVASVGRLVELTRAGTHILDDLTWGPIEYGEWVECENLLSLLCVCLPSIIRLIKHYFQKSRKISTHGNQSPIEMLRSSTSIDIEGSPSP